MNEVMRNLEAFSERRLKEADKFQLTYTIIVLVVMFGLLVVDRYGTDSVMALALTMFMAAETVNIKDALAGFSNEGVLTVMALFVVAEGITKTGALDWYMTRLLGKPKSMASAQIRLMVPVAVVSAFFNNTPIVVIMIPVVLKWCKHADIPVQQMMIPLSYATILGGTITIIGTSTNLVVTGLLTKKFPKGQYAEEAKVSLFDLAPYGFPFAIIGLAYIMVASPFLLPFGQYTKDGKKGGSNQIADAEDALLRARVTQWSPAAGRSVKRSGLRETGGIYLVSVQRAATGNTHRAVGQDFILNAGDIVFFTGLVEGFGEFCDEHGLEVITNEIEDTSSPYKVSNNDRQQEVGISKESLLESDNSERLRIINRLSDIIKDDSLYEEYAGVSSQKIVVSSDQEVVLVGIDAQDRPGLLTDVSKALHRLKFGLRHTEAAVVGDRSISVWRCENLGERSADLEEIWCVLNALLEANTGIEAVKRRGLIVIRAQITKWSSLIGRNAVDVDFRTDYDAAIVAVQNEGKNTEEPLATLVFEAGDILILQASNNSVLLTPPPEGFYTGLEKASKSGGVSLPSDDDSDDVELGDQKTKRIASETVWKDLQVVFDNISDDGVVQPREFLSAMVVAPNSRMANKSVLDIGLDKLPSLTLISVERPSFTTEKKSVKFLGLIPWDSYWSSKAIGDNIEAEQGYSPISLEEPLKEGDILWYCGSAKSIGELRRIPGLLSNTHEEVVQMSDHLHDRRLVQAVVARNGPLVGKTVKQSKFRTKYGAVVIGVHREGKRIHDHPGNVKLQAGDVLLLESGPTFRDRRDNERSFALLSEVEDSAPPRLHLLIPAAVLMIAMLAVYTAAEISLLTCALVAGSLMVLLGVLSEQEARDSLNWELYVTISAAFGIGTAMEKSGVAAGIADGLVQAGKGVGIGDAGVIAAVYAATTLISSVLTNNAAAALIFPIAIDTALKSKISIRVMSFAVMLGSSEFATPFGYQCNLLVYGPGRYKFNDYAIFGIPLQVVLFIAATAFLSLPLEVWWINTLISAAILFVVTAVRISSETYGQVFSFGRSNKGKEQEQEFVVPKEQESEFVVTNKK